MTNHPITTIKSLDSTKLALVFCACIATPSLYAQPDLSGVWILNGRAVEGELALTEEGLRIQNDYDLLVDDPSLYCIPSSASRVWANPNVRIGIEQFEDRIYISHEFFDLRRDIPLGDESDLSDMPNTRNVDGTYFQELGSSFAYYQDDRLIIESRNHSHGYIRTSIGVPQGENTKTIEELWVEEGVLHLKQTYLDETLFEIPFVLNYEFRSFAGTEIPLYQCTDADYDWFNELNATQEDSGQ